MFTFPLQWFRRIIVENSRYIRCIYHYRTDLGDGTRTGVVFNQCSGHCEYFCAPFPAQEEHPFLDDVKSRFYYTAEELANYLREEQLLCYTKKLGITFLGKEPLNDPYFCYELAKRICSFGMNLNIWTCGHCDFSSIRLLSEFCDMFVFQFVSPLSAYHHPFKTYRFQNVLENLYRLDTSGYPYRVRIPVREGVNSTSPGALSLYLSSLKNMKSLILDFSLSCLSHDEIKSYRQHFLSKGFILY